MSLTMPTRRGLLAGIIAAAVAPVIVRTPGLIMPIKPGLVPSPPLIVPGTYLGPALIAGEMARQMYMAGSRRDITLAPVGGQHCCELVISEKDRCLPMDQFSDRYLRSAAAALSRLAPNIADMPFVLPKGVYEAAIETFEGVHVRYLSDYDIATDSMRHRFDVLSA